MDRDARLKGQESGTPLGIQFSRNLCENRSIGEQKPIMVCVGAGRGDDCRDTDTWVYGCYIIIGS